MTEPCKCRYRPQTALQATFSSMGPCNPAWRPNISGSSQLQRSDGTPASALQASHGPMPQQRGVPFSQHPSKAAMGGLQPRFGGMSSGGGGGGQQAMLPVSQPQPSQLPSFSQHHGAQQAFPQQQAFSQQQSFPQQQSFSQLRASQHQQLTLRQQPQTPQPSQPPAIDSYPSSQPHLAPSQSLSFSQASQATPDLPLTLSQSRQPSSALDPVLTLSQAPESDRRPPSAGGSNPSGPSMALAGPSATATRLLLQMQGRPPRLAATPEGAVHDSALRTQDSVALMEKLEGLDASCQALMAALEAVRGQASDHASKLGSIEALCTQVHASPDL